MIYLTRLIYWLFCIAIIIYIKLLNEHILKVRRIWTEDNEPSVKMSFNMFYYLYTMTPKKFWLRNYSVHIDILSHEEPVDDTLKKCHKIQYREYCPIVFNQFDTLRYMIWKKYKRHKESYNLEKSVKYAKVFSSLIPDFIILSSSKIIERKEEKD